MSRRLPVRRNLRAASKSSNPRSGKVRGNEFTVPAGQWYFSPRRKKGGKNTHTHTHRHTDEEKSNSKETKSRGEKKEVASYKRIHFRCEKYQVPNPLAARANDHAVRKIHCRLPPLVVDVPPMTVSSLSIIDARAMELDETATVSLFELCHEF